MIYKPYSLLPSDLQDGSNVIDLANDTTFSFMVTGTTPIDRMGIQIGNLEGEISTSLSFSVTSPVYYTNMDGSAKEMLMTFSGAELREAVGTSCDQKWRVWIRDINNEPTLSDWVFVKLRTTPSAVITTATSVATKYNTWTLVYSPSLPYENGSVGTTATEIRSVRWRVFDKEYPKVALYDTGEIFGCVQPTYTADGLMSEHTYYAEVTIVNQDGVTTTALSDDVVVRYAIGPSSIMELVYTDEIPELSGEFSHGREVALNITNFSGEAGESSGGKDGYDIVDIGEPTGYVVENHAGNVLTWDDISIESNPTNCTFRMRFTPVPYKNGENIAIWYVNSAKTKRARFAITTGADGGSVFPADDLYPSESLYPNVGSYYITAFVEFLVDGSWEVITAYNKAVDINNLSEDSFVYYEQVLKRTSADFAMSKWGPIMSVELYGVRNSKVAYVVIDKGLESYSSSQANQLNPPITSNTVFAVFFNNMLCAVNLSIGASPERVTFYRYQDDENAQFCVAKIELGQAALPSHLIDFSAANGESYQYVMYPEDDTTVYAGTHGYRESDGGASIEGFVECETLITANWSDDYNAYVADKVFYFNLNNKPQPINNNAVVQKNQTFGRFYHIQHGATNVLSGQISSLLGYLDCSTMEFVSSFEIEDAIRWLTTDHTTKFYKSARGYVLPVDITSVITFTPTQNRMASDVSLEWTEIKISHSATVIGVIEQ